jgi:hypothetical protein
MRLYALPKWITEFISRYMLTPYYYALLSKHNFTMIFRYYGTIRDKM